MEMMVQPIHKSEISLPNTYCFRGSLKKVNTAFDSVHDWSVHRCLSHSGFSNAYVVVLDPKAKKGQLSETLCVFCAL